MKNLFIYSLIILTSLRLTAQTSSAKHLIKYLEINTTKSDYGLAFLENDKVVFAMPIDEKSKRNHSDLFVGEISDKGEISNKELIKGIKQLTKVSKTGITYSSDFKTVYFSAKKNKRKKSKEKDQLFRATIDASGTWINIEKLPFNDSKYSTGQPTLSKDGKKLYFVSDRQSSYGGTDIFVVAINDNGTYGEPTNLGEKINTSGNEVTPFITDNNVLYFSSNGGKNSQGNLDVYASEIFNNSVSEAYHLEAPINSINDDFAYIINKENNAGYFSSNRLQGQDNNDMYSFILEEVKPEKCVQEIAGIVKDKETQEILNDAAMTLFDNEGNQIQQIITDENGAYKFSLDCNQTYTLVASSLYYIKDEHIVNTANYTNAPALEANKLLIKKSGAELEEAIAAVANDDEAVEATDNTETETTEEIAVTDTQKSEDVVDESEATINPVYFGFDQSNITNQAAKELDKIAAILNENATLEIEVSSYTDARGSSAYNIGLSNRRAKASVNYLVSQGVDRDRIKAKGYGESRMINKCVNGVECSEEAHAKNRRTEFVILNSQTYNEPVKNNSEQSLSLTNNKKNVAKNKEENVAKHLYDTKKTGEAIESVVSESKKDLVESTKNQQTSLNNETNFSETDKEEELVDNTADKNNEIITEKEEEIVAKQLSNNKILDEANESVVLKGQNDLGESIKNQPTSINDKSTVSKIDQEEVLIVDSKEENTINKVEALTSSENLVSQTSEKKRGETLENKPLISKPKNQSLVNDDRQTNLVSNNLATDNDTKEITDKLVTQVDQKISNDDEHIKSGSQEKKDLGNLSVSENNNSIDKVNSKDQSDTSLISLNDKSQSNDEQTSSNELLKNPSLNKSESIINNNSFTSKRISEEDIPKKPEQIFNKDLSKATDNIKSFSDRLNEEEGEINDRSIKQKTKEVILLGKIEKNAPLKTGTVDVSAMTAKRNGDYTETGRASKTHAISVNFKMYKNGNIAPGNKEIFIVIQNPQKKVINEKGTFTLRSGKEIPYSDETVAYYNGRNIKISILSDRFIQEFTKGTYIVQVYIERYLTGQTLLVLS